MANEEHVAILKLGVAHWNGWRRHNTHVEIDLREAILTDVDFSDANLSGADLTKANLSGAKLHDVNLSGANLANANLSGASLASADLSEAFLRYVDFSKASLLLANFSGADLTYANLTGTNLFKANFSGAKLADANLGKAFVSEADLSGASLVKANFSESNLAGANVSGANLTEANLSTSRITGIKWAPRNMRGKYLGVRGLDSTYGNALFKRAAADQDFLDTLEHAWHGTWRMALFRLWGLLDYGRSMLRVAGFGFGIVGLYGIAFATLPGVLDFSGSTKTWFTPFYFSIVTFTTLGFGDVRPKSIGGELLASSEVIIGYMTLGLLLAVLAEKLARRS
jgi:uncharacterized protein YjbI with pentapeptide repeats